MQRKSMLDLWGLPAHPQRGLVAVFALLTMAAIAGAVALDAWWMVGIPGAALVAWVAIVDFKILYFLMLACIPLSTEVELPGGLATDLFSEPLMWLLTLAGVVWLLRNGSKLDGRFFRKFCRFVQIHFSQRLVCHRFLLFGCTYPANGARPEKDGVVVLFTPCIHRHYSTLPALF